jgi:hypothetical protein
MENIQPAPVDVNDVGNETSIAPEIQKGLLEKNSAAPSALEQILGGMKAAVNEDLSWLKNLFGMSVEVNNKVDPTPPAITVSTPVTPISAAPSAIKTIPAVEEKTDIALAA